jgi:hypothetical protein
MVNELNKDTMQRHSLHLFFILLIAVPLFAGSIFSEYSAKPYQDRVEISWTTKSEIDAHHFTVSRSNDNQTYINLKTLSCKGPGTTYSYVDKDIVFKSIAPKYYRIKVYSRSGKLIEESDVMIVHPNISGIFRTWGAIKAIFR